MVRSWSLDRKCQTLEDYILQIQKLVMHRRQGMKCDVAFWSKRKVVTDVAKRKTFISDDGKFVLETHCAWEIQKSSESKGKA